MPEDNRIDKNLIGVTQRTLGNFWERTQISGVSHAKAAPSSFRSIIWMAIFTTFTAFTVIGVYEVANDYMKRPVTTSVTVKYQNQVL